MKKVRRYAVKHMQSRSFLEVYHDPSKNDGKLCVWTFDPARALTFDNFNEPSAMAFELLKVMATHIGVVEIEIDARMERLRLCEDYDRAMRVI